MRAVSESLRSILPLFFLAVILLMPLWWFACDGDKRASVVGSDKTETEQIGNLVVEVQYRRSSGAVPSVSKTAATILDSVVASVVDSSGEELTRKTLAIEGEVFSGRLSVPAASALTLRLGMYQGNTLRWLGEYSDFDVMGGVETRVEVEVYFTEVKLSLPESVELGDSYSVKWEGLPLDALYRVERADNVNFEAATVVYQGPDSVFVAQSHRDEDSVYYRISLRHALGSGIQTIVGPLSTTAPELRVLPSVVLIPATVDTASVLLANGGNGVVRWQVEQLPEGLTVEPAAGSLLDTMRVLVQLDRRGFPAGTTNATFAIRSNSVSDSLIQII